MTRKAPWILLTLLTVVATLLAACQAQTTTTEEGGTTSVTGTITHTEAPPVYTPPDTTYSERPKYGGTIIVGTTSDPILFDDCVNATPHSSAYTLNLTNNELLQGDWTKGPAGTGETSFLMGSVNMMRLKTGDLADSWEIPEPGKIIFHIREGVHWQNKAPCNGRELTLDDVVYSVNRALTKKGTYIPASYPALGTSGVVTKDEAARTVTVTCAKEESLNLLALIPNYFSIFPKDALEQNNDNMNDWKKAVGTGPYYFTDFVSAGSMTFTRNPNYWEKNPIGPGKGDQLPYADSAKILILPDTATYMAAFRVGKLDGVGGYYNDVKEFLNNPEMKHTQSTPDSVYGIYMRTDKTDSPFSKLEVRQALYYATDFNKIVNDYFEGHATLLCWPISPIVENTGAFVPFEELPAETKGLFTRDVNKAKELLTKAGYPTGFSCSVLVYNSPANTDYLSQIIKMWSEAGITLTLDAKDYATYMTRYRNRTYDDMIYGSNSAVWQRAVMFRGPSQYNLSYLNDSKIEEFYTSAQSLYGIDDAKLASNFKAIVPYITAQCWMVPTPNQWYSVCWWPWVKNWNGELYVGFYELYSYMKYRWCDVELKKQMTGR